LSRARCCTSLLGGGSKPRSRPAIRPGPPDQDTTRPKSAHRRQMAPRDMILRYARRPRLRPFESTGDAAWAEERTVLAIPSINLDQELLDRHAEELPALEERCLYFLAFGLRRPHVRLVVVTCLPVPREVLDYYLGLVPADDVRARIHLLSPEDDSPPPSAQKILERPDLPARLRSWCPIAAATSSCRSTSGTMSAISRSSPTSRSTASITASPATGSRAAADAWSRALMSRTRWGERAAQFRRTGQRTDSAATGSAGP
jgi:hypothetical protein